jgi:hypothetical protein
MDNNEIRGPEDFDNVLNEAAEIRDKRLQDDEEYALAKYIHKHTLITALSVGILDSYAFYHGYQSPPHFETVLNAATTKLLDYFKNEREVFKVSLVKLKIVYKEVLNSIPQYLDWNTIGNSEGKHHFISTYDRIPNAPSFIDLECPVMNSINYIRDKIRTDEAFSAKFEESWAADPNNPINIGRKAFQEGKSISDNPFLEVPGKQMGGKTMAEEWSQGFNEEKSKVKIKQYVFIKTSPKTGIDEYGVARTGEDIYFYNKRCFWFTANVLQEALDDFIFTERGPIGATIKGQFVPFDESMVYKEKAGRKK